MCAVDDEQGVGSGRPSSLGRPRPRPASEVARELQLLGAPLVAVAARTDAGRPQLEHAAALLAEAPLLARDGLPAGLVPLMRAVEEALRSVPDPPPEVEGAVRAVLARLDAIDRELLRD